jgi:hypothetical protein
MVEEPATEANNKDGLNVTQQAAVTALDVGAAAAADAAA